jgi:hypothetical protein
MALCLATSLLEKKKGFDPKDKMGNYCDWWKVRFLSAATVDVSISTTQQLSLRTYGPIRRRDSLKRSLARF